MFAGKSSELLNLACREEGKRVIYVSHASDTRYGESSLATHDGVRQQAQKVPRLRDVRMPQGEPVVLAVDEAQFFEDLVDGVKEWLDRGHHVIVSGLDGTAKQEPFDVVNLVPLADSVCKLAAVCECGARAIFSARRDWCLEGPDIEVGGAERYRASCRDCLRSDFPEARLQEAARERYRAVVRALTRQRRPSNWWVEDARALATALPRGSEQRVHLRLLLLRVDAGDREELEELLRGKRVRAPLRRAMAWL